jgi:hypothetical protein
MAAGRPTAAAATGLPDEELPGAPWFSLRYYGDMTRLTERQWYVAIGCRLGVQRSLPATPTARSAKKASAKASHWSAIAHDPIAGNGSLLPVTARTKGLGQADRLGLVVKVGPLTDGTVQQLRDRLEDERFALCAVDLAGPDQDIKMDFRAMLKSLRTSGPVRRPLTRSTVRHWAVCRVLPYIDIKLYERATDARFRTTDIRNALFPDARTSAYVACEATQTVAQSTVKFAAQLLDERWFESIAAPLEQD